MSVRDPNHWLHRLSSDEWLRAADNELQRAEGALLQKQQRPGVAGARRAAGMAWNALMTAMDEARAERYGRSYMDHLKAVAGDDSEDQLVRAAAQALLQAPLATNVIPIGRGDTRLSVEARVILDAVRRRLSAS